MRILFVWTVTRFSIWDVAKGYRKALARVLGEENVIDYFFDTRIGYHRKALPPEHSNDMALISKLATETMIPEALYENVDAVLIISGLNIHAAGLWLLEKIKMPTGVVLTESPYEDMAQAEWLSAANHPIVFTNERVSAAARKWTYLPHSYDPEVHRPVSSNGFSADVVLVGSGWQERQALLEAVDWTGIDLKLIGPWPTVVESSPIHKFIENRSAPNSEVPVLYAGSKICLNFHRKNECAESLGPRAYELAACGAFQVSDYRAELDEVFSGTVPTFNDAAGLESLIRHYLAAEDERRILADAQRLAVAPYTFDSRVPIIVEALQGRIAARS